MSLTVNDQNLGHVTAYGYAKSKGYTGTEEEFATLMASYGTVAQAAAASAEAAASAKTDAEAAQEAAETAAEDVSASAAQIVTNTADISDLKSAITDIDPENIHESELTKNLINKQRCVENKYVNYSTGALENSDSYIATDYIPVVASGYYRSFRVGHYAVYDSDKAYITGLSSNLTNHQMPANAAYIRVDFPKTYADEAYVNIGIYGSKTADFTVEYPWLDSSKKIKPDRLEQYGAYFTNLFNKDTAIDGVYVEAATGAENSGASYFTSDLISVKPNTVYVMSVGNRYAAYDAELQFISGANLSGTNKEFTTPNNAKYIRVSNTPLTLKDTFVVAEKEHYTGAGESYGISVPWIKGAKSKYDGKTLVCFGDSITNMGYTDTIKLDTGINAINVGISSGRYAYSDDSDQYVNAFAFHNIVAAISTGDWTVPDSISGAGAYSSQYAVIQAIKAIDFTKVDFVSIAYGTNDFSSATTMDNESDPLDTNTFKGAIRYCLKTLTEKYPKLKIIGATPVYRFWSEDGVVLYDSDEHEIGGKKLTDYVEAVKSVFAEFHLPVVDNYSNAGINKYNRLTYYFVSDGLHPNADGRAIIGHRIGASIVSDY